MLPGPQYRTRWRADGCGGLVVVERYPLGAQTVPIGQCHSGWQGLVGVLLVCYDNQDIRLMRHLVLLLIPFSCFQ